MTVVKMKKQKAQKSVIKGNIKFENYKNLRIKKIIWKKMKLA